MSYYHFNEVLLNLQGVKITNVKHVHGITEIYLDHNHNVGICTHCGAKTSLVHDYRMQKIKDSPAFNEQVILILRKRRLHCPHCNHHFYQKLDFLPRYYRMTTRLIAGVINTLRECCSFSSVARTFNLSITTVIRIFDLVSYPRYYSLPKSIAIDEFRGNADGEKFQCIITDPETHRVLDILPKRQEEYIRSYFRRWTKEERNQVSLFVSDMWRPYQNTANDLFHNATRVIDKYHWTRQVIYAFENVRKNVQKGFYAQHRKHMKRSRQLLLKPFDSLSDEQKREAIQLLEKSDDLKRCHFYKEKLQKIIRLENIEEEKREFLRWIKYTSYSEMKSFDYCISTYKHWLPEILNSMDTPITNGFTEGCNNKIKVLKRNAYGYRNFRRFRNRILHIFSYQQAA